MNLCSDCKWLKETSTGLGVVYKHECGRVNVAIACTTIRADENACGREGRWFESKFGATAPQPTAETAVPQAAVQEQPKTTPARKHPGRPKKVKPIVDPDAGTPL